MHHTKFPFLPSSKAIKKMWTIEFPYVKKTDFMYGYKNNVTVSETDACKISTYSRKFNSLVRKKNGSTSFSLLE